MGCSGFNAIPVIDNLKDALFIQNGNKLKPESNFEAKSNASIQMQIPQIPIQQQPPQKPFIKLDETKEGLNIYKPTFNYDPEFDKNFPYFCPICEEQIEEKYKNEIIENVFSGPKLLNYCTKYYINVVENKKIVNIFEQLCKIHFLIEETYKNYDNLCYYKLKCKKTNEEFYFCLFNITKEEAQKIFVIKLKDERYKFENWKNDLNLYKTLLQDRQYDATEIHNQEVKKRIKEKADKARIEIKIEWEKLSLEKEYNIYLSQVQYIKTKVSEGFFSGTFSELYQLVLNAWNSFSYIGGKKKIKEFIAQYAENENTKEWFLIRAIPEMSEKEKNEYEQFAKPRMPKVKIVIDPTRARKKKKC